jgi:uncharacterized protein (DUF1800 family)
MATSTSARTSTRPVKPLPCLRALPAVGAPVALTSCGGGTPTPTPTGTPTPTPVAVVMTGAEASRFLAQATTGASKADITSLQASSYSAWLDTQLGMARPSRFWDFLTSNGYNVFANRYGELGFDAAMWGSLIGSGDTLRQRVGLALLSMLVVSAPGTNESWYVMTTAAYLDMLWDNAFGNFRTLLDGVASSVAMGRYLTFIDNVKANPVTGTVPDENFARELMQLFSIGLYAMNSDGSLALSNGNPVETYSQADIAGLARVWTGWTYATPDDATADRMKLPMINIAANHESGAKTFLGTTIPANTDGATSKKLALDAIFAHANVPPFVCKQLIQHLVTSNPSAAYVGRIAAVFVNNGNGVRGDLKAVIRAILTDTEARSAANVTSTTFGKLREPVVRLTQWARAFGVTSPKSTWGFLNTNDPNGRLGESPGRSPSVFNFFRPGYTPPGSQLAAQGLLAPEFQITTEPTVIAYVNWMQELIVGGAGDSQADYTALVALSGDSQALLNELNLVLAANQISAGTIAAIKTGLDTIPVATAAGQLNRVQAAVIMVMAAPEYLVLK